MEIDAKPEQEKIIPDDEERERQPTEEIEPEDDMSSHGTFDAETNSELSFTAPLPNQVGMSDRVQRPRFRVDYYKVENPDEFELFAIMEASRMGEEDNSVMTRMTMKLTALKHEDDYDSNKKMTKWLVDQCRPTEELSSSVLQIETLDQNEPFQPIDPPGLEDYCRKISLPPTVSKPDYSFFMKYYDTDFLNSSMPPIIAATADFAMSSGLAGALNREKSN